MTIHKMHEMNVIFLPLIICGAYYLFELIYKFNIIAKFIVKCNC